MAEFNIYEKENFKIENDKSLLSLRNIESVKKRSEHLAKWCEKLILKNTLLKSPKVLSVGCGLGFDVFELISRGFDAKGIEPVDRSDFWIKFHGQIKNLENTYAVASDRNIPFNQKFDFIFAFEVLEHVGTIDHNTKVGKDTKKRREEFLSNLINKLNKNGILIISCPNKLFPADFGHGHNYVPFSSFFYKKFRFSPTIPWSKENFLPSPFEIKNFLKRYDKKLDIKFIKDLGFFSFTRSRSIPIKKIPILIFKIIVLLSKFLPIPSPHLVVMIKLKDF